MAADPIVRALRVTPGEARPGSPRATPATGWVSARRTRRTARSRRSPCASTSCTTDSGPRRGAASLLVLQGMDAAGKDGTIRRVLSGLNPQGCEVVNFKQPSPPELAHDYLWRVHATLPAARDPRRDEPLALRGRRHRADRSASSTTSTRRRRFRHIREFERMLTDEGTTVVKVFLHISKEEQRVRLQARIDNPEKNWKFRRCRPRGPRRSGTSTSERYERGDRRHLHQLGAVVRGARRSQMGPRHRRRHDPRGRVHRPRSPDSRARSGSRRRRRRVAARNLGRSTGPRGGSSTRMVT